MNEKKKYLTISLTLKLNNLLFFIVLFFSWLVSLDSVRIALKLTKSQNPHFPPRPHHHLRRNILPPSQTLVSELLCRHHLRLQRKPHHRSHCHVINFSTLQLEPITRTTRSRSTTNRRAPSRSITPSFLFVMAKVWF